MLSKLDEENFEQFFDNKDELIEGVNFIKAVLGQSNYESLLEGLTKSSPNKFKTKAQEYFDTPKLSPVKSGASGSGMKPSNTKQMLRRLENLILADKLGNRNSQIDKEVKTILVTLEGLGKITKQEKKQILSSLKK